MKNSKLKNGGARLRRAVTGFTLSCSLVAVTLLTACVSVMNKPEGKILSVTQRGIGFKVSQNPTSQMYEVVFGFFSSAIVVIPTSTNKLNAPNFANTFDFAQAGPTQLGIGENISTGDAATYRPGATNSAVVTQPATPK